MQLPPIALIVYKRPESTKAVLERIAEVAPSRLYVIADGPKDVHEKQKCREVRSMVDGRVKWDCRIHKNYASENLGCKRRVSSGLDWLFEHVEEAIILEDDCVPHPSFFRYSRKLLDKYRDDERVMCISGDNFQRGITRGGGSYYFSKYAHCWGWATWKSAWRRFDVEMEDWPEFQKKGYLETWCPDPVEREHWAERLWKVYNGDIDTWDYQWMFSCWANGGLTAVPNSNLVRNIGFGEDATHTHSSPNGGAIPAEGLGSIKHPELIVRDSRADRYTFKHHFAGQESREPPTCLERIQHQVGRIKRFFLGSMDSCAGMNEQER